MGNKKSTRGAQFQHIIW